MAQTKTAGSKSRGTSKRTSANGSRAKASSNGSGSGGTRRRGGAGAGSRSGARKTTGSTARKRSGSTRSRSGASSRRTTSSPVSKTMQKAKGPAIAGGAALVGLAGGLALKNGKRRNGLAGMPRPKLNLSLPKPKGSTVKVLGGAAKEIAKGGYKIGQLTSEVQKVRKAVEAQDSGK